MLQSTPKIFANVVKSSKTVCQPRTRLAKRSNSTIRGEFPKPGSPELFKALVSAVRVDGVNYYEPEKVITIDDIETNPKAEVLNGRLRYIIQTQGTYEEALKVVDEATASGAEPDFRTYIYLSTLLKPEIPRLFDEVRADIQDKLKEYYASLVPEPETFTQAFALVARENPIAAVDAIVQVAHERKAKLDIGAVSAMFDAYEAVGDNSGRAAAAFHELHKNFLIDTPTYDAFIKANPKLSQ